jgi:hypothetical protein
VKPVGGRAVWFADLLVVLDASDWGDRLRLPASFARGSAGELPDGVALYHTGGSRYWNVNAERQGPDVLLLTVSWRRFATENALSRGFRLRLRLPTPVQVKTCSWSLLRFLRWAICLAPGGSAACHRDKGVLLLVTGA